MVTYMADQSFSEWLRETRRDFHAHPELAFMEIRTTEKILKILKEYGVEAEPITDLTGCVGMIYGNSEGPTLGLRADIDALPITEMNELPYKSVYPGKMHACGHDANTTVMLGVARKIMETDIYKHMRGNVKLLFQPAEEGAKGARKMIDKGVLDNPRVHRVIAGHMTPDLNVGTAGIFRGIGYASSDTIVLRIIGTGGHGARPEEGNDPIVAGAHFVTAIQSIVSRNVKPTEAGVVTIGKFVSGSSPNIIPRVVEIEGSIRALSEYVRSLILRRIKEIVNGIQHMFSVTCEFEIHEGVPVLVNDVDVADSLYDAAQRTLGRGNAFFLPPVMGSEDFVFFTLERPSAIMRFGCGNREKGLISPLHSPYFNIDEDALDFAVEIILQAVKDYLAREG